MTLPPPPAAAYERGQWRYGRYAGAIANPNIRRGILPRLRCKEWHYTSVSSPRLFLAFGLVQLGYAANAFVYVVDRKRPSQALEYEALSPLGQGLRFAPSSILGTTRWRKGGNEVRVSYRRGWDISLDLNLQGQRLVGDVRLENAEALGVLTELESQRPAYTHKEAGLPATGRLCLGDEAIDLQDAHGTVDWTRSLAERETRWKWASLAGRSESGKRIGLNLSAEIYDDAEGNSRENAYWLDGSLTALSGVTFDVPENAGVDDWRIQSKTDGLVDLRFRPLGARAQHLDLGLIRSDFVQPYGLFEGRVGNEALRDVFGVVENHVSVW